jgi:cyclic beta-1,2-glucan synthetase
MALAALEARLVDPEAGLIKLLAPPLAQAIPSAGYIQAYPPGVRENGGQYSHAGVWALMAQAEFANSRSGSSADRDTPYRYFTYLSPAHRAAHPTRGPAYGVEPYVVAGDVYGEPPYVGRGGWSWYTGAAAWLQRAAIESIFGLQQGAQELVFKPCLPSHWQQAELTLVRDDRSMRFILLRATPDAALEASAQATQGATAQLLLPGERLNWHALAAQSCFVIPLPVEVEVAAASAPASTTQP